MVARSSLPAQQNDVASTSAPVRPQDILRFHAPVAATIVSYAIVFNILNSAMARTPQAAGALAGFAVAQGLVDLVASPASMCNQWIVSRGRDRASLRTGLAVILRIIAIFGFRDNIRFDN